MTPMSISGRTKQEEAALRSDACVRIAAAPKNSEGRNKMQKKRWFALMLALVLVMSLLPISSLAANVGQHEDVSEDLRRGI